MNRATDCNLSIRGHFDLDSYFHGRFLIEIFALVFTKMNLDVNHRAENCAECHMRDQNDGNFPNQMVDLIYVE